MFKKTTLKNGLRIITVPQKETQAVTILVLIGTGSKYERKEISGISHFLEHIFFKGTKKRPSPLLLSETLDKVGGIYNAFTSQDCTGFWVKVDAPHFDLALDFISDILLNSLFVPKEIKKEKGVIIEEINMQNDNPMTRVQLLWLKSLYGDQPAGWNIAGQKEIVKKISQIQLLTYLRNHYLAKNTIICLAGKIKEKEALTKVKRYFLKVKKGIPPKKPVVRESQKKPNFLLEFKKSDQSHICLGVRAYNLFHPQKYTQILLAALLGGMMSSRIFIKVREELGLAYYLSTEAEANPDTGFLVTQAGLDNEKVMKGISAILREYKKISQKGVSGLELKKVKDNFKGKMALSLETSDSLASFYGIQEILEGKILTQKEIFKKIDDVKALDILRVAQDVFQPQKLNLALVGPFKDKKKFEKLLKL